MLSPLCSPFHKPGSVYPCHLSDFYLIFLFCPLHLSLLSSIFTLLCPVLCSLPTCLPLPLPSPLSLPHSIWSPLSPVLYPLAFLFSLLSLSPFFLPPLSSILTPSAHSYSSSAPTDHPFQFISIFKWIIFFLLSSTHALPSIPSPCLPLFTNLHVYNCIHHWYFRLPNALCHQCCHHSVIAGSWPAWPSTTYMYRKHIFGFIDRVEKIICPLWRLLQVLMFWAYSFLTNKLIALKTSTIKSLYSGQIKHFVSVPHRCSTTFSLQTNSLINRNHTQQLNREHKNHWKTTGMRHFLV